jgi:hypothetical protein
MITRLLQGETRVEAVQKELEERDEAIRQLKNHLMRAQDRMKHFADKKRSDRSFQIGEWVFLKLRSHRQNSVATRIVAKLAARYYGPFQVIERIGTVAYKLKLPEGARVHPVFHVSLLKKAIGDYQAEKELPPDLAEDYDELFKPESVLATRMKGQGTQQVLIKWTSRPIDEATWEDVSTIRQQFPDYNLEDKVAFLGGGIDRDHGNIDESEVDLANHSGAPTWKVYSRRKKRILHTT